MSIFTKDNVKDVAQAIAGSLVNNGRSQATLAAIEAKRLTSGLELINKAFNEGAISESGARAQLKALEASHASFLATRKAIKKVDRILAMKAGLAVIAGIVNKAIGFKLLPSN